MGVNINKDELKKALEDLAKDPNLPINQTGTPSGGFITKKSPCCDAPVIPIGTGLIVNKCSKCNKEYNDPTYG